MLVFCVLSQKLEEGQHVQRDNKYNENCRKNFCPARQESVDGTRFVLGEVGIRRAGNNAEALLIAFLKDNYNNDGDGNDRQYNAQNNAQCVHNIVLSNAKYINQLIYITIENKSFQGFFEIFFNKIK